MRALFWIFAAGCVSPSGTTTQPSMPPTVSSMTPSTGPYGTTIAIAGTGFDATTTVEFAGSPETDRVSNGSGLLGDTALTTRYPFPATGAVTVENVAGTAVAGTFTPVSSWAPGTGIQSGIPTRTRLIGDAIAALSETASGQPMLAVWGGSNEGAYVLDAGLVAGPNTGTIEGDVVADDAGAPEVLATTPDGALVAITLAGGQAVEVQTGVTGARFVAAGRDATGIYAWLSTDSGLVRMRPGASGWTTDAGPVEPEGTPLDAAIAADGTLVYAYAASSTCLSGDDLPEPCYELHATAVDPAGSGYPADEDADHPLAFDAIDSAQVALAPDGTHVLVTANVMYQGQLTQEARERGSDGTWSDSPCSAGTCAYDGDQLAELVWDDADIQLVSDVDANAAPRDLGMWPASPMALVFDGSGAMRPLVSVGELTWAPTAAP